MTSVLNVDTIADKAGTGPVGLTKQHAAKAWQNLDGTSTISTRDSFNIASTTDTATGRYKPNFTNAMNNSSYAVTTNGHRAEDHAIASRTNEQTTSQYEIMSHGHNNTTDTDTDSAFSVIHGDLA